MTFDESKELRHLAIGRFRALFRKGSDEGIDEFNQAYSESKQKERESAQLRGEPYARLFDFPLEWDAGAPMPCLLQLDNRAFLLFYLSVTASVPDNITIQRLAGNVEDEDHRDLVGVVEFFGCVTTRMGDPNDEVFHGHPLAYKGGELYTAQIVENSPWIGEIERINSVHSQYKPEWWRKLHHFIFWFHDSTFECVARSFEFQVYQANLDRLLPVICARLTGNSHRIILND